MGWYQKLTEYFPEDEMKKKEQMDDLVHQNQHYKIEETNDYIMLYAEYDDFIFVDYILVDPKTRGKGVGSTILEDLKKKGKNIILEVEPVQEEDPDTEKRRDFYLNNGFHQTENITYYRDVGEKSPEYNKMELYYWSPEEKINEEIIRQQMIKAYEDIHLYHYETYHDREAPETEELIRYAAEESEQQMDEYRP